MAGLIDHPIYRTYLYLFTLAWKDWPKSSFSQHFSFFYTIEVHTFKNLSPLIPYLPILVESEPDLVLYYLPSIPHYSRQIFAMYGNSIWCHAIFKLVLVPWILKYIYYTSLPISSTLLNLILCR